MNARILQVGLISTILIALGIGLMAYKSVILGYPLFQEDRAEVWTVETRVNIQGSGGPVSLSFAVPQAPDGFALVDEDLIAPGFGTDRESDDSGRNITVERRSLDGVERIFALSRFYRIDSSAPDAAPPSEASSSERIKRAQDLLDTAPAVGQRALQSAVEQAREQSVDDLGVAREIAGIFASDPAYEDAVAEMEFDGPDLSDTARRLAFTLNIAGIDARRVSGIAFEADRRSAPIVFWTEIATEDGWRALNPDTGEQWQDRVLARLAVEDASLIDAQGGVVSSRVYATKRSYTAEIDQALWRGESEAPIFTKLSPLILSVEAQLVFQVLLLLPIGALAIAFIRQVVGIRTFGTFMPVLITLAFRETQLALGISLFLAIVVIGLLLRSYFNTLHLTLVPRLTAVLSIVTLIMLVIAVAGAANNIRLGLSLSLFPIVILTMTIESMSLIWDEYGPREAIIRASGSLFSAIIGYLVISIPSLQHIVFIFPEVLLVVIGLAILLGRYNGFTLLEFMRFRMIGKTA